MASQALRERRLARMVGYTDVRRKARQVLPRPLFEYVDGGADDEVTARANEQAFRDVMFRPRTATWVAEPGLRVTVLGSELSMPIMTAPCGGMRLMHPEGDLGVARAAAAAGTVHVATASSGFSLEEIAACPGERWFQLYRFANVEVMQDLVRRAGAARYHAMVVTVDSAVSGNRERDFRNGFSYKFRINASNAARMGPQVASRPFWLARYMQDGMPFVLPNTAHVTSGGKPMSLTDMARAGKESHSPLWEDIAWIRENWEGPVVIKGITTVEDARRCVDVGADGIIISNHGGRQLDSLPATLRVLPEIRAAVGDDITLLLDSGIRRGSDVLKAKALGAQAVLVGRPAVYGLAIAGQSGVERMLEILRTDLVRTLRHLGCPSVDAIDESYLRRPLVTESAVR